MQRKLKSSINFRLLLASVTGLALVSCQGLSGTGALDKAAALTPEDVSTGKKVTFDSRRKKDPQAKLGAREHPKILAAHGGSYQDERLELLLAPIVGRLVAVSNDPGRAYDITVLNSASINAFALPGGYLYITRGLLALANDKSEIAAVLAHEMAHVAANHGVQRDNQTKAVDIAGRVAKNVVSNPIAGKLAKASTKKRLMRFSQEQELQADAVGIKMLGASGYDPFGASRFLQSMDRYSRWRSALKSPNNDMSLSHPSTPRRVELARRHARTIGPAGSGQRGRTRYFKGIDGIQFGGSAKEGFIRGQSFYHVKLGVTFKVPAGFELTNKADAVIAAGPNQVALRFDAVDRKGQPSSVKSYLQSGWVNGLIKETVQSTTINGMPAASARATTGDWQFHIAAVQYKTRYYRFILAAPRANSGVKETGQAITRTFKAMTASQKANLKPLKLKVVTIKQGDTIATLATQMQGVSRKVDLFRALNGLASGERLKPGRRVKLVING